MKPDQRTKYLRQLEDALLEDDPNALPPEEDDQTLPVPHRRVRADFGRTVYEDEPRQTNAVFEDGPRPKGAFSLVLLAIGELLAIGAIVWWWIQWLT